MPKKMLHPPRDESPFVAAVSWGRDHDVQIGVQVADPDKSIVDVLFGGEHGYLTEIGRELVDRLDDAGYVLEPRQGAVAPDEAAITNPGLGQMVLRCLNAARAHIERDGLWADLDRRGTNDAVRALRTGRDAAFGKDA